MVTARHRVAGEARYELPETIRDYGRSRLDEGARDRLAARHAAYYGELALAVEL